MKANLQHSDYGDIFFNLNKKKVANMDAEIEQVYVNHLKSSTFLFSKVSVETFQMVHAGK